MWFIGVEEGQETSAPPPKKNPGSAPGSLKAGPLNTGLTVSRKTKLDETPPLKINRILTREFNSNPNPTEFNSNLETKIKLES